MFKAFKYRLEPNVNQTRELETSLETHRRLYNACLRWRKESYETNKHGVNYVEQSAQFTLDRKINPYYARINFSSAQATMRNLDKAFKAFFRRVKSGGKPGYPRFKARNQFHSITFPSGGGDGARIIGNKLRLQHIGLVRINLHRLIEGTVKTINIKRELDKWYVTAVCKFPLVPQIITCKPIIGIDVGLESFLTTSDGEHIYPLQPMKPNLGKLRISQRSLSRKKKGSNSREKQRRIVSKLYLKISNVRKDAHHKIAVNLINRYGAFVVESLNVQGMVKNHRLARAVLDAGWASFLMILKNKAESAGLRYEEVSARYTSQICPECGKVKKKTLSERRHDCDCGYSAHRDHAAARVILARGIQAGTQPERLNVSVS